MKIQRSLEHKIVLYANQFRAIALMGIRQSGKTTLCKMLFPNKPYLNFENIDVQLLAEQDPNAFLDKYKISGAIFDEIQKSPSLFNYIQEVLDNETERGKYILTGSSNFLLNQNISQSLAGRVGFLELLPLSYKEINASFGDLNTIWQIIFKGGFPEIWMQNINPSYYFPSYIQSFIERDIRQLINIKNLILFQQFIKLVATRAGQEWNSSQISNDLGIDSKTVSAWLSYLQTAGIVYLLPPYYANFGKRVIKRPKLYLTDTGVLCSLLGIQNEIQLENHPLKGSIFENFVILEFLKEKNSSLENSSFYYWRSISGVEIDLIIEKNGVLFPIEIKSGTTYQEKWWKNIMDWQLFSKTNSSGIIVYGGNENHDFSDGRKVLSYKSIII
jgi:uncharacterized protein